MILNINIFFELWKESPLQYVCISMAFTFVEECHSRRQTNLNNSISDSGIELCSCENGFCKVCVKMFVFTETDEFKAVKLQNVSCQR